MPGSSVPGLGRASESRGAAGTPREARGPQRGGGEVSPLLSGPSPRSLPRSPRGRLGGVRGFPSLRPRWCWRWTRRWWRCPGKGERRLRRAHPQPARPPWVRRTKRSPERCGRGWKGPGWARVIGKDGAGTGVSTEAGTEAIPRSPPALLPTDIGPTAPSQAAALGPAAPGGVSAPTPTSPHAERGTSKPLKMLISANNLQLWGISAVQSTQCCLKC